ncbi:hypothetical protein D3C72_2063550 [compost metagenome]
MIDNTQSFGFQPGYFFVIVYNVTKTIEVTILFQNLLCHIYSVYHSKAKAGILIDVYC